MAKTRLKSGEFAMELEQDPPLWTDRKRILGLPISFTRYTLTARKLLLNTGLLNLREEEVLLYRVRDVSLSQSLLDRLFGVGTLCVDSSDLSVPHLHLRHVKNPDKVKAALSQCVEQARRKNRIRSNIPFFFPRLRSNKSISPPRFESSTREPNKYTSTVCP